MNGSLVCFSTDNFETCFFATVVEYERQPQESANRKFRIKLEMDNSLNRSQHSIKYVMIESKVFFEVCIVYI